MLRPKVTLDQLRESVNGRASCSEWMHVDQTMIDGFAKVTGDDAFIHVDPQRAQSTVFKGTIAHGLLTLSLLPVMMRSATPTLAGTTMGVNYGFDRVRFMEPVPVDADVRGAFVLTDIDETKPAFVKLTYDITVEIRNVERPAAIVRWVLGRWMKQ